MRSIDDIIDKLDTSSVEHGPDESQSPTVRSWTQQPAEGSVRDDTSGPRHVTGADGAPRTETTTTTDRDGAFSPATDRLGSTRESAVSPDTEPLWMMFGSPLSQLCRRLLVVSTKPKVHERTAAVAESESTELRPTDMAGGKATDTTNVSKNLRQSTEVQSLPSSVDVRPSSSSRGGVVRSNGHKPPIPTKPSLPPKPPISKKPSFGKETATGVTRKPSSVSSPAAVESPTTQQQRLTSWTASEQSDRCADGALTTAISAPASPTAGIIQRDEQRLLKQVSARRTAGGATTTRSEDHAPTTNAREKTKPTTTGAVADRRRTSPVCDRVKTTKSEEFLARIYRRSVSPVGTPRLVARSARGASVDLSAASDTSRTIGRRTLSKEWAVLTTTTHEEVVVIRPPTTTSTVHVDAPRVTSSTAGVVKGTADSDGVDSSGGRTYKTAIDNIRLSVGGRSNTACPAGRSGVDGGAGQRLPAVSSPSSETPCGGGSESCQLDDLISSLIEIAVDVEGAQTLQPQPSVRHGVLSSARY